jgi:LCP family protein required for cell wall assembly
MMLDRFDDPEPFVADQAFRDEVRRRGRRRIRRRRLATGAIGTIAVLVFAVGFAGAWTNSRLDGVERIEVDDALVGSAPFGEPTTVLLVGTDGAPEVDGGSVSGQRADTMMVVRLDPGTGQVRVLSVPRDLWVDLDGTPGRINGALEVGGPDLAIRTVEQTLGVDIDHYVQIDFAGFVELVDLVGGVRVAVDAPMRDEPTGLSITAPGCVTLDGQDALAFVRSRRVEVLDAAGNWIIDPTGDMGRVVRQQVVAQSLVAGLATIDDPLDAMRTVTVLDDHAQVDQTISNEQLVAWADWGRTLGPDDVRTASVTVEVGRMGNVAVLHLLDGGGPITEFLGGTVDTFDPGTASDASATVAPPVC